MTVPFRSDGPGSAVLAELARLWEKASRLKAREGVRVTQRLLAQRSGVPNSTVSSWATGTSHPRDLDQLLAVAKVLAEWAGEPPPRADAWSWRMADGAGRPAAGEAPVRPPAGGHRLPRDIPAYTGRAAEFSGLVSSLEAGGGGVLGIYSVDGLGGVGKTTFAVHAAYRLADRFPDGQIFLRLNAHVPGTAPATAEQALADLLLGDGLPPGDLPDGLQAREHLWRERTARRRMLLVLDDAANAAQVQPLIPASPQTLVIVTSRRRLTGLDGVVPISLEVLDPGDAVRMFLRVAGRADLDAGDRRIARLAGLCGFLPLALRITAARLRNQPAWDPADLLEDFDNAGNRLKALEETEQPVTTALALSFGDLTDEQRRLFRLLGAHPGTEYEPAAAAALTGTDEPAARRLLAGLEAHRLIDETPQSRRRYRMHDLVREYAAQLASEKPDDTRTALMRLLEYYMRLHDPGQTVQELPLPRLRAERENLLACIEYAHAHGPASAAAHLTRLVTRLTQVDGPRSLGRELCVRAVEAMREAGDDLALARALTDLGTTLDYPASIGAHTEAAELYAALGDRGGQAAALTSLGHIRWMTGDYPAAHAYFQQALPIVTALGDRRGQARLLRDRGELKRMTGDLEDALADQTRALAIYRELGLRGGQAGALAMLGEVRYLTGDYEAAARDLEESLAISRDLGNESAYVNTLVYRADVRAAQGDLDGGIADLEYALAILRRDPGSNEAWTLGHYAALIARTGDTARALELYRQTVRLSRECTQPDDEALALEGIGECLAASGDLDGAIAHTADAARIFTDLGMRPDAERATARLAEFRCHQ